MDENIKNNNPKYVIKPRFSLLYELIMPTGKKIKSSLLMCIGMLLLYLVLNVLRGYIDFNNMFDGVNIEAILSLVFLVLFVVFFAKLVIHIVLQTLQYKNLSFCFFDDYMVYEDSFLNQHRKTIQYSNIKEVEIRRTITDRILGYGIIVIYTNAENSNNGLVIYSIKKPQECYDKIQNIINNAKNKSVTYSNEEKDNNVQIEKEVENVDEDVQEISKIVNLSIEDEEKFNDSLKNINND